MRPARPQGHGGAWEALEGEHAQIVNLFGEFASNVAAIPSAAWAGPTR
ncbi:hypothetical protein VIMS_02913 [Mycobacterium marinum]|nr:hypothetical protein [Mycobacterium marinum]RFZ13557.1 hypothetical protein VIMS_02913 [Mycobacterium marinum]